MDGFLLVDKQGGWTSHDVVAKVRNLIGVRKVGHAGTLDPMATGLLVLGVGRATRLLRFVQDAPKEYVTRAQLGVATDTLDADGAVLARDPMPVRIEDVSGTLDRFRGPQMQVPPMVSALRVEGRRLYDVARSGEEVPRAARAIIVYELEIEDFAPSDYPEVVFRVVCSRGTYVRTLVDDIARALGGRAHLTELRRVRNGSLSVSDAITIEGLAAAVADGKERDHVLAPVDGLADLPAIDVPATLVGAVSNGIAVPVSALEPGAAAGPGPVRLIAPSGRLLAVYAVSGHRAAPEVVLP